MRLARSHRRLVAGFAASLAIVVLLFFASIRPSNPPAPTEPGTLDGFSVISWTNDSITPREWGGRVQAIATYDLDGDGVEEMTYDSFGRPLRRDWQIAQGLSTFETWSYDDANRMVTYLDATSRGTISQYDPYGRSTQTCQGFFGEPGPCPSGAIVSKRAYDLGGRLVRVEDPEGYERRWAYDQSGRVAFEWRPDGTWSRYAHYRTAAIVGQPATTIERTWIGEGTVDLGATEFSVSTANDLGRLTSVDYAGSSEDQAFTFDAKGRVTLAATGGGQPNVGYWMSYTYNAWDEVLSKSVQYRDAPGSPTLTLNLDYDEYGRLDEMEYPAPQGGGPRTIANYEQDKGTPAKGAHLDRISGLDTSTGVDISIVEYNLFDTISQWIPATAPLATAVGYTYDWIDRITEQRATLGLAPVVVWTTTHFNNNAVASDSGETYQYDAAGRLTFASGRNQAPAWPSQTYSYLENGNRESRADGTPPVSARAYWYDADTNRLDGWFETPSTDTASYEYTSFGAVEQISITNNAGPVSTRDFAYNDAHQLADVKEAGIPIAEYRYGPDGFIAREKDGQQAVNRYQFWFAGHLIFSWAPGQHQDSYFYIGNEWVAFTIANPVGQISVINYAVTDRQGSLRLLFDSTGTKTWQASYKAFGEQVVSTPGPTTDVAFVGRPDSTATGLSSLGARWYDPVDGRFLAPDPILGNSFGTQGPNAYAYAENNPKTLSDPSGLSPIVACGDWCWLAGSPKPSAEHMNERIVCGGDAMFSCERRITCDWECVDYFLSNQLPIGPHFLVPPRVIPVALEGGEALGGLANGCSKMCGSALPRGATPKTSPGPFAGDSVPASGLGVRPTAAEQAAIDKIGYMTGCHSCGTRNPGTFSGHFIGDHQPGTRLLRSWSKDVPQFYLPHCAECSASQGGQIANMVRTGTLPTWEEWSRR